MPPQASDRGDADRHSNIPGNLPLALPDTLVVSDAGKKGRGLFAKRALEPGERLLCEAPLVCGAPAGRASILALTCVGLAAQLSASLLGVGLLDLRFRGVLLWVLLAAALVLAAQDLHRGCHLLIHVRGLRSSDKALFYELCGSHSSRYWPVVTELRVFRFNAVSDNSSGCLCAGASFVNHSCAPNACFSWDEREGKHQVTAMRAIREGEEIMVSYIDLWQSTAARQRSLRRNMYFDCLCTSCSAPSVVRRDSDRRRQLCAELERRLPQELLGLERKEALRDLRILRSATCVELGLKDEECLLTKDMDKLISQLENEVGANH